MIFYSFLALIYIFSSVDLEFVLRVKMKAQLCWVQGLHLLFGIAKDRLVGTMNG